MCEIGKESPPARLRVTESGEDPEIPGELGWKRASGCGGRVTRVRVTERPFEGQSSLCVPEGAGTIRGAGKESLSSGGQHTLIFIYLPFICF